MHPAKVPFALLFASILSLTGTFAQNIKLINSGEVIQQAVVLYDSGKFEDAIALFKSVPKRDTNYVYMLSELAMTYDANKNYKEAIATSKEGLQYASEYRAHLFRTLGSAWDGEGDLAKSVEAFETALKEFPYDYSLHYNLGVAYYNHQEYAKAEECFFKTLMINPYHPGSHLNLGRLSAFQGKKVRGMMAMGMYLSISNNDNDRLVFLERFLNNELKDESTFPFKGQNSFDKLDQMIRAKVVSDKNFKPRVPINAMLVRQYQFLLEQLSLAEENPDDPWIKFYLPVYKGIQQNDMLEPFLYHLLTSTKNDDVNKWKKKNEKKLNQFYELVNDQLQEHRKQRDLASDLGFRNPVPFWYDKENRVASIGHKNIKGQTIDKWIYFSTNGVRIAEGSFDKAGNKINTWSYFYTDGKPKSIENYTTGEMTTFTLRGEPRSHYFLKNDQVNGEAEVFYSCGQLKEKLGYVMGKKSGEGKTFYLSGQTEVEYNYKDDKLEGAYKVFFEDGKLMKQFFYKNDLLDGDFKEYHIDGTLLLTGNYKDGKATGLWKYFHTNGEPERSGNYVGDSPTGEWSYYDLKGKLIETRYFDTEGKRHGENVMYHNGVRHYVN
ncbi:MAG TPA: tetratricopeptide repeat protein, partial [Cyclobacteriaceae bacterium]|nr:tetratricopeptide repeat protein [Cyclobacteriaceae bacterium]